MVFQTFTIYSIYIQLKNMIHFFQLPQLSQGSPPPHTQKKSRFFWGQLTQIINHCFCGIFDPLVCMCMCVCCYCNLVCVCVICVCGHVCVHVWLFVCVALAIWNTKRVYVSADMWGPNLIKTEAALLVSQHTCVL